MKPETYVYYLEAVVLSLLAERPDPDARIQSTDTKDPSLRGTSFSPYNVMERIARHRAANPT